MDPAGRQEEEASTVSSLIAPIPIVTAEGNPIDPHLSGGEVVRICNPCVPDPNIDPRLQPMDQQCRSDFYQGGGVGRGGRGSSNRNRHANVINRVDPDSEANLQRIDHLSFLGNVGEEYSHDGDGDVAAENGGENRERSDQVMAEGGGVSPLGERGQKVSFMYFIFIPNLLLLYSN